MNGINDFDMVTKTVCYKNGIPKLRGVEPSIEKMRTVEDMGLGYYTGGFEDRFDWQYPNYHLWDKYSEEELYELYIKLTKEIKL